jgi:hypothetical protein
MRTLTASDGAKALVRRNTEEVQGNGNFNVLKNFSPTISWITPSNVAITPTKPPAVALRNVVERAPTKSVEPAIVHAFRKEDVRMLAELKVMLKCNRSSAI